MPPDWVVPGGAPLTWAAMDPLLLAAKVWHYWISVALFVPTVVTCVAMGLYYVFKVMAAKYPRQ